jgi:hypothetical protein
MSDATSIQLLRPRPLLTADAAALLADVAPQAAWQPTHVLEIPTDTTSSSVSGTSLASAGDVWRILLAPPSAMANSVFYPVALRATFLCGDVVGFDDFFELTAGFAIEKPEARSWAWDTVDMKAPQVGYDGSSTFKWQNINPEFHAYPVTPATADGASTSANALGGFMLTVKTWDATAAAQASIRIDARWLAFPRPITRSAGFYTPRLFFKPA